MVEDYYSGMVIQNSIKALQILKEKLYNNSSWDFEPISKSHENGLIVFSRSNEEWKVCKAPLLVKSLILKQSRLANSHFDLLLWQIKGGIFRICQKFQLPIGLSEDICSRLPVSWQVPEVKNFRSVRWFEWRNFVRMKEVVKRVRVFWPWKFRTILESYIFL